MRPLVGDDHRATVDRLVGAFDAVAAGGGPRAISLEASLGLGKTRLVQELYGALATTRQPGTPYWPARLDWSGTRADDVLHARKQVDPTPGWVIPGGTSIPWLWWGISCQLSQAGHPMRSMKDASDQLRAHLDPLLARLQRADHDKEDALELLSGVFDLVGAVGPGGVVDAGSKLVNVFQRWRGRNRQHKVAAMDRRIDATGESYEEARRIAEGLTAVARAQTPVVLVVDDAQWADPALVSLLRHLIGLDSAPILIVTTAWPEKLANHAGGAEAFSAWLQRTQAEAPHRLERIAIDRLAAADLGEMIRGFAPNTEPTTVERIADIASGNPLVLNLLLDLDLIRRDVAADGRIDTDPATLKRLPSNLRAIYQDLWKQLPVAERRVLALVAVQGPEFLPGFVRDAATRLEMHGELMAAFAAARDVHGWIRAVNEHRYEFTERHRFEVAEDVLRDVFSDKEQGAIRAAIVAHVLALKATPGWLELDLRTRRLALEGHLEFTGGLEDDDAAIDSDALVDSMRQLAVLELDTGDAARAAELMTASQALRSTTDGAGSDVAEAVVVAELVAEIQAVAAAEVAAPASAAADEWGREPWVGWQPREVPSLTSLTPSEVAELVVDVVSVEGPVVAGRVYRLLVSASGAGRQGRAIRASLDAGVRSAVRRGQLVASVSDVRGDPHRRVLRTPTQPDVVLRVVGDRTVEEIPPTELGGLGQRVMARELALSQEEVKRRVAGLIGAGSVSRSLDGMLERVLPTGAPVSPTPATDAWGRVAWVGWTPREVPALPGLSPRAMADLIAEVVAVEGPVVVGRVIELLRQASSAAKRSKSISDAVESGIGSGVRRGDLVMASGRRGEPDARVLRLATQPEVVLRTPGDRDVWSIPGTELAALAAAVQARDAALDRDSVKRQVADLVGWSRYTAALDKLLESVMARESES
ncbi:MAG: AAA family ATPase [Candidatus Limnocylindrales bacterium]